MTAVVGARLSVRVSAGDVAGIRAALAGLDEPARRQLGADLTAYVRDTGDFWLGERATALAVAAAGCLPTAAKAAAVLGRRSVSLREADAAAVVEAVRERGVAWLPDLAYRLAARLGRTDGHDGWQFVADLLTAGRVPPPAGDWFVEGWLAALDWMSPRRRNAALVDRLRTDAFLDALVPRLFEIDGIGGRMTFGDPTDGDGDDDGDGDGDGGTFVHAVVRLAGEGRLDRGALLDGCVGRLLRGDRPAALRAFVDLHRLLAPDTAEVGERCGDYLRLLADAPTSVASAVQRALRGLPDVELDAVLDTSRAVLTRPDRALVRSQLGWLDRLARRHPDRKAEIAAVLAEALDHPAVDVRDRAGVLAARHGAAAPAVVVEAAATVDDLPPPPAPVPVPPPITDVDELAEEVAVLLDSSAAALPLERVLDGLVRLAATDRSRTGDALSPVLRRASGAFWPDQWWSLYRLLTAVLHGAATGVRPRAGDFQSAADLRAVTEGLRAAAGIRTSPSGAGRGVRRGWWAAVLAGLRRRRTADRRADHGMPPPQRLLRARLAEIGRHVGAPGYPGLLAAPTAAHGALDPGVLYERLARLGDHEPWPWDLAQALLRLPAGTDEPLAAEAAALRTPAGELLAGWLRTGGLPRPVHRVVTVASGRRPRVPDPRYEPLPRRGPRVEVRAPDGFDDRLGLLTLPVPPVAAHADRWTRLWPAMLPGHRGLVAAYALPTVAAAGDPGVRGSAAVLPLLAECSGDGGPALDLALAYGLGARHEIDRAAALDALLLLAAAGDLDATAVGAHLGTLSAQGAVTLNRTVRPLRDAAAAGARLTTWRVLAAALPPLLALPTPPRGTPDLLTLAAETATGGAGVRAVAGLADVAARGGSSRVVVEARRLATALGG